MTFKGFIPITSEAIKPLNNYRYKNSLRTYEKKPRITVFKPFLTRNWKWTSLFALSLSSWFSCMKWVSSEKKTEAPLFLPLQPNGLSDVFNAILIRITLFCLLLFRKKFSSVKIKRFSNFSWKYYLPFHVSRNEKPEYHIHL